MIQSSFSDPDMIVKTLAHLLLFVHQSCLTSAQKVIENGHGLAVLGAEDKIVDYAELVVDEQANLPSQVFQNLGLPALSQYFQFTICSSIATGALTNTICFFQLLRQSGTPWINLCLDSNSKPPIFKISVDDDETYTPTTNTTDFIPQTWIHSCVSIDSALNHVIFVANGKQLDDRTFSIPSGAEPPKNLSGKLLLLKAYLGFWYQPQNKVSSLNIFSKQLTLTEMVSRTAGDDCGKSDGDYLDWENSEWVLKGKASLGEVTVEDLCRRESRIQVFTAPGQMDQCKNLCNKIQGGTMATLRSETETQEMFDRVDEVLWPRGGEPSQAGMITFSGWVPIVRCCCCCCFCCCC